VEDLPLHTLIIKMSCKLYESNALETGSDGSKFDMI